MAEYGSMFLVSGLAAILFFGGWHGPIPIAGPIATTLVNIVSLGHGETWVGVSTYLANFMGCVNFLLKGFVGVTVMMWIRWTLPRLRIDQVMTTCLKYCVPLAAVFFVGAMFWQLWDMPTGNDLVGFHRGSQTEHWVETADLELMEDRRRAQADLIEAETPDAAAETPSDEATPVEPPAAAAATQQNTKQSDTKPSNVDQVAGTAEKGGVR